MRLFFKEHFQPIIFQKVERLKTGEILYERRYLSLRPPPKISLKHDHNWTRGNDQSGSTVEQQPVGKLVQQSFGEVPRVKLSKPTQSKPNPICDRSGKLEDTERVFVDKGKTSRSHKIDENRLHKELGSSDRSGKPERLSEGIRVKHAYDGTGQPVEQSSSSIHTVKEKFFPEENRDIAPFNADNEFNRAIDEENIDFNIPRVPNSTVKRSHGVNVRNLIQKIENHPQRQALQSDLQQHRAFNPFSEESKDAIKAAGNTNYAKYSMLSQKHSAKHAWRNGTSASSTACAVTSYGMELDNLIAMESLCYSAKGSNDAYDVSVSLTGYEPNFMAISELNDSSGSFSFIIPSSDQDMDDATLGKLLTEAHRGQADYCDPEGVSVSQSSLSVVFDRTGKSVGERNDDQSIGFGVTRNTYSAHSKFSENTQAEKVVDRLGQPEERNSSNAQIRTLLDEQRQMIIAEYCEKIGHHELQAARAEEERRLLREELWRQQLEFREAHQQSLTEMEVLRKFQSSTFDTIARRKVIEDQNTILELSGRVQEQQNEVNCMNDSKDFQDAESVRSGNSHVTSQPMLFPKHPIPGGLLRHSFVSPRRKKGPPCICDTHGF